LPCSRARMMPEATICASQRIGAASAQSGLRRVDGIAVPGEIDGKIGHAAGMDHPPCNGLQPAWQMRKLRLRLDQGEGLAIDLRRILDVVAWRHSF